MKATKHNPTFETLRRVMFEVACRYLESHGVDALAVYVSEDFYQAVRSGIKRDVGKALLHVKLDRIFLLVDGKPVLVKPNLRGLTVLCR